MPERSTPSPVAGDRAADPTESGAAGGSGGPTVPGDPGSPVDPGDPGAPRDEFARVRDNVGARAVRGVQVGTFASVLIQVASVASTVVVARLLTPTQIGLVAASMIVVGLVDAFTQMGLNYAITRTPEIDRAFVMTTFVLNSAVGLLTGLPIILLASPLAVYVGAEDSEPYLRALGLLLIVQSLALVPRALLLRRMQYQSTYAVEIASAIAISGGQIGGALAGWGAWSLVFGLYCGAVVDLLYYPLARWYPTWDFDRAHLRYQLSFGGAMWIAGVLRYLTKNVDNLAVSRVLGAGPLGLYYIAFALPNMLRLRLTTVTGRIMTISFASFQEDLPRLDKAFRRSLGLHGAIGFAAMAGLAVLSSDIVRVFFGEQWTGAIVPMAIIAVAVAADFTISPASSLLVACGKLRETVIVQAVRVVALAALAWPAAIVGGLAWVAAAALGASVIASLLSQYYAARLLGVSTWGVVVDAGWFALPSAVMAGALFPLTLALAALPAVVVILLLVPVGVVVYGVAVFLLSRRRFAELRDGAAKFVPGRVARALRLA